MRNEQNSHPTVYAIVVTYNGSKWIEKCLSSLKSSVVPLHMIVIDNASADDTVVIIEKHFPEVELIKSKKNLGFGAANNIGLRRALEADADYVILLNQDAYLEPNTVEEIIVIHSRNKDYGIISAIHMKNEREVEPFFNSLISERNMGEAFLDWDWQKTNRKIFPVNFVHAAFWMVSRECLEKVGMFDPIFPHYGEDNDYCNRVLFFNLKVGIVPSARIVHDIGERGIKPFTTYFRRLSFLETLKRLDQPFKQMFQELLVSQLKLAVSGLLKLHFKKSYSHFSDSIYLTRIKKKIARHRRVCMNGGSFNK